MIKKQKPLATKEAFLNRVHSHLPSKTFADHLRSSAKREASAFPSLQQITNTIALVAGEGTGSILARYANVNRLRPDRDPSTVPWGGLDLLLVAAEILPYEEPWRRALLGLKGEDAALAALMKAARENGVPVVVWLAEEVVSADMFQHLFAAADHLIVPDELPIQAPCAVTVVQPPVDVKTFNPLLDKAQSRRQQERFMGFLIDGSHEIGIMLGPQAARDYFHPLFKHNWWLTDSSFDLRNGDHKIHPVMRRRFMGSMRHDALSYPLKLALAYFLPDAIAANRPSYMRRRVMEAAACKTLVFTNAEIKESVEDLSNIIQILDSESLERFAHWVLSDRLGCEAVQHLAWREALSGNTYFEFLETVLGAVGCEAHLRFAKSPKVNIVVPTVRPDLIPYILETVARQVHTDLTLNIVVNSTSVSQEVRRLVAESEFAKLHTMPSYKSIGYCLNYGIDQDEAHYWAKFDDDDVYGPHYLSDMLLQRKYVDFDVTGKASLFTYFEEFDRLNIRRLDNRDTRETFLGGGTILARPEINVFPEDVRGYADTLYLAEAAERGHVLVAADPFNFVQIRRADKSSHTWTAGAQQLNLKGPQRRGLNLESVVF